MLAAVGAASQAISALMSALAPSSGSSSTQAVTASGFAQALPGASRAMSPPPTQALSGDMLNALMQLTQNSDAASSGASAADPVQQLFSAMDSDGDGEVSQSEMESTVEKFGGTQAQADSLFNSLSQTSASTGTASGISESQMQSALSSAQQAHGGGRHHHHHMQGGQADQVSNTLLQAMDSDDDGAVSQDELTSFVTANGGTAADAASDFAALDTSGSGALTSADFAKAFQSYQSQQNQQSGGAAMASLLDTLANASGTTLSA